MSPELIKTIFVIVHVFGAVIGAGGAFYSDIIFIKSLKDEKVSRIELSFLKSMSVFVWVGLFLMIISGIVLFALDPYAYAASSKFIAKMVIVAVIFVNGIFFHLIHVPFMDHRAKLHKRLLSRTPHHEDVKLILSGVVSIVSWSCALILGSLQFVPLSYGPILGIYMFLLSIGSLSSIFAMKKVLSHDAKLNIAKVTIGLLACSGGLLLV